VPILTGDPATPAQDVVAGNKGKPQLENLSDKQPLRAAARQALVMIRLVEEEFNGQLPKLMNDKPAETAVFVGTLAALIMATIDALRQQEFTPTLPKR
jgi:hypothetical protein